MAAHLMYLWVVSDEEIAAYLRRQGMQGDDLALVTSASGDSLRRQRDKIGREVDGMFSGQTSRHDTMMLVVPFVLFISSVGALTLGASMFAGLGELVAPIYCGDEVMDADAREFVTHDAEDGLTQTTVYKLMCHGPDGPYEPPWLVAKAFGLSLIPAVLGFIVTLAWGLRRLDALRRVHAQRHDGCVKFRAKIRGRESAGI